jgi:GTPase SAR1 family protein
MSKLSKRKTIVLVGNRIDTTYERQKNNREQAIEIANNTPDEIKKPTKYDLKR